MQRYKFTLVRYKLVSPWPACVDDVSSAELDADLLAVVVVVEVVVTVVVSGPTVQTIRCV